MRPVTATPGPLKPGRAVLRVGAALPMAASNVPPRSRNHLVLSDRRRGLGRPSSAILRVLVVLRERSSVSNSHQARNVLTISGDRAADFVSKNRDLVALRSVGQRKFLVGPLPCADGRRILAATRSER